MRYFISIVLVALSINVNAADVMVMDAYVRATPPGAMNSAAFMTLHNHSASEKALVSAETTAAKVVELHNHVNENGVMKMRQVAGGIKLPAHGMCDTSARWLACDVDGSVARPQRGQCHNANVTF